MLMIRKTVFLLLILTGIIPFACCPENPSGPYQLKLYHITPHKSGYMHKGMQPNPSYLISNEVYLGNTLLLELAFTALQAKRRSAFTPYSASYAWSCDNEPNFTSLKDKVEEVEVYSDKTFNAIAAGKPLTEKALVYHYLGNQILTLKQAISNINTLNYYDDMQMGLGTLVLPEKPASPDERTFTVRIRYESGREESMTTYPITW